MLKFVVIEAPSILGLKPTGVENLPKALKAAGFLKKLDVEKTHLVESPPYNPKRDISTHVLNPQEIHSYSLSLAKAVSTALQKNQFPIVLGGDCSIVIGNALALKRLGRYGLFFIDGHADFYQPEASTTGQVADMDLAIVSGRGPDILTNIDGLKPLISDNDIVLFGYRDAKEAAKYGSQDVRNSNINTFDLSEVRNLGMTNAVSTALDKLSKELSGFWIHLDVDVLDDSIMPAVDYRMKGGLSFAELGTILKTLLKSGRAVGMDITIFNPSLDKDGSIAQRLVSSILAGLC
jgi:arginase